MERHSPREIARQKGEMYFVPLSLCSRGHALRLTSNGKCVECSQIQWVIYYERERDRILKRLKHQREADPQKFKQRDADYKAKYPEKYKAKAAKSKKKHRKEQTALENKRRANKLRACPQWVDFKAIEQVYKNCPEGYTVDHIVPLQSEIVCGLHVHWNLQYLTPTENYKKGNRIWEHHPNGQKVIKAN